MQKLGIVLFALLAIAGTTITATHASSTAAVCPAPGSGEKNEDCPWAGVARLLEEAADLHAPLAPVLETHLPRLLEDLREDASRPELLRLWGRSINFDEGARDIIVLPEILQLFSELLGVPAPDGRIVHAGMEHTYGYLFSVLKTSFGYKRARWVQPDIEEGFGLPRGSLGPTPEAGTLLNNVSAFIGRIALRDDRTATTAVSSALAAAPLALRDFDFSRLRGQRLEETLARIVIRTDLVPFFEQSENASANTHLLIYSILDRASGRGVLISAFPVATGFTRGVLNPANLGENKPISTRYNAHVDGVTGSTHRGIRRVVPITLR